MVLSPKRRVLLECLPFFYPFGNTPAHNALEECGAIASPGEDTGDDKVSNVLFLGCGDLRNPLATSAVVRGKNRAGQLNQNLDLHLNDASLPVITRNVLLVKIISSPEFEPNNDDDMGYVWDIWYNATFSRSTAKRFAEDVRSLIDNPLPTNVIIPKSNYLEELKAIWTDWLAKIKSSSVVHVLAERAEFMTKRWSRLSVLQQGIDPSLGQVSFSFAVDQATKRIEQCLLNDRESSHHGLSPSQKDKLVDEVKQYFKTGISGRSKTAQSSVNPTFLQPLTGKWVVHYASCPFDGYLPIPLNVLGKMDHKNWAVLHQYCLEELKKLVMAFLEKMDTIKFYFHPCDALVLCYDDNFYTKFDVIDTSNLADHVGLANLLTGGSRKLRSDASLLFTESMLWTNAGSSEARYLQEVLCCPLSLIPTVYGLRLLDNVELEPEALPPTRSMSVSVSRLRWKKSLPFVGVQLGLSSTLEQSLKQLRSKCFYTASFDGLRVTGVESYSPLTFFYVLSDLIHRGGDAALMASSFLGLPPVFRKSIESNQAWMEQRTVWRVKVVVPFSSTEQAIYDQMSAQTPILRLVLFPTGDLLSSLSTGGISAIDKFRDVNSTDKHFVDNIELELKLKPSGLIDRAEISFLLEDRTLLQTHCGMVIEQVNRIPVLLIGLFSGRQLEVEPFHRRYPNSSPSSSPNSPGNTQLVAESCVESVGDYHIRLKVLAKDKPPSGLKVTTDQRWPCESAHRIIVSLDGIKPLPLTLPYPILPSNLKATLRRKDGTVELKASKALQYLWPEDYAKASVKSRWDPNELELWTDKDKLNIHLGSQFNLSNLINLTGNQTDALCQVRETIRTIFVRVSQDGHTRFQLKRPGEESKVDWFIRAHPPICTTRLGAPVLLLSAADHHKAEILVDQGKLDRFRTFQEFQRIFDSAPGRDGVVTILLYTDEEVRLISYLLSLNATKIQPSSWQEQNLPLVEPSPWLATFIRPLYREEQLNEQDVTASKSCMKCFKIADKLKRCASCKIVSYCSVECQRADWPAHKPHCATLIKKK